MIDLASSDSQNMEGEPQNETKVLPIKENGEGTTDGVHLSEITIGSEDLVFLSPGLFGVDFIFQLSEGNLFLLLLGLN